MNKLDTFLRGLSAALNAYGLEGHGDTIRRLVAEDKAAEWKRDSDAALARRARLNGSHKLVDEWRQERDDYFERSNREIPKDWSGAVHDGDVAEDGWHFNYSVKGIHT